MTPEEEKAVADKRKLVDVFRSELMKKVDVSAFILIVAYARTSLSLSLCSLSLIHDMYMYSCASN
jgi:hypothetical protein